jgi:hypothetical protein
MFAINTTNISSSILDNGIEKITMVSEFDLKTNKVIGLRLIRIKKEES